MIGTSAGSMVAAHLRVGTDEGDAFARIREGAPSASYGRLGPPTPPATCAPSSHLDKRRGRALVGQAALTRTHDDRGGVAGGDRPRPGRQGVARGPTAHHRGRRPDRHLRRLRQHERRPARAGRRRELRRARHVPGRRGRRAPLRRRRAAQHRQRRPGRGPPSRARPGALPGRPRNCATCRAVQLAQPASRGPGPTSSCPTPRTCGRWVPTRST